MKILFTQEFCPKCELAKQKLKELNIKYIESRDANEAAKYDVNEVPCLVFTEINQKFLLKDILRLERRNDDAEV